jgi:SAM-dependent methyltransferase
MKLKAAGMRPRSQAERGNRQAEQQKLRVDNQQLISSRKGCSNTVGGIAGGEIGCRCCELIKMPAWWCPVCRGVSAISVGGLPLAPNSKSTAGITGFPVWASTPPITASSSGDTRKSSAPRHSGTTLAEMTGPSSSAQPSGGVQYDFDALYRGESPGEGVPALATPPWDTKAPKENVVAWHEGGWVHGDVLDIGCGLGDNAIYLARQGFNVTGLDISPTALITAERRAKDAGVDVTFAVTDSTKLEGYTDAFDTIVDSGMFHCLDDDAKRSYAAAARRATRPGATLLLSCFSDANPSDDEWPRPAVSEQTLRDVLGGAGWHITSLEPASWQREIDGSQVEMAFWYVRAQRR